MSLTEKRSVHKATKLDSGQIEALLLEVPGYKVDDKRALISKDYSFKNFYETIASAAEKVFDSLPKRLKRISKHTFGGDAQ